MLRKIIFSNIEIEVKTIVKKLCITSILVKTQILLNKLKNSINTSIIRIKNSIKIYKEDT